MTEIIQSSNSDSQKEGPISFRIKVWDLPIRCFHWSLVVLVIISFTTGKIGPTAMVQHEYCAIAILILLVFRLVWGCVGGRTSRFSAFVRGPKTVIKYAASLLSKESEKYLGHNPMGGWSVLFILTSLLVQAVTGLFANDDILTEGPLFNWVSKSTSDMLTRIHLFNKNVLVILVLIHVGAILFYLIYKKDNLVWPMINGVKEWHQDEPPTQNHLLLALLVLLLSAIIILFTVYRVRN